jgi:hypothetical protein
VNANAIAVGIKDHRHPANRRGEWLDSKFHIVALQLSDGSVKVFHFECGAAAVGIWFESRSGAKGQSVRTKFILGPLTVLTAGYSRGRESQNAFVKFRARCMSVTA